MPLYCLHCLDKPEGGAEARAANRPAHLAWAAGLGEILRMAGPLLNETGAMVGSVFLVEAADIGAAKALHAQDPYVTGGVFGHVHINETRWAIGDGKPA
ncbi:MAG: YciI family protein [Hyphomonas sp.]|uniref:YciI family protein n=1 Tax=Hyphomonas sp. TaxID=87 RepID=UPI0035280A0A